MSKAKKDLQLIYKAVDALIPYARNARVHSDAQIAQIAASIREFGFIAPVIVDGDQGIIAGHGRVLAARKLGLEQVPCIEAGWLTEAQKRAYILADNKLAENAGWDTHFLGLELLDLQKLDFDISNLGFDAAELSQFLFTGEQLSPEQEWEGMPDFDQPAQKTFRSLIVHFDSNQDVLDFQQRIGQKFSDKSKFIYHPKKERNDFEAFRYVNES